MTNDINVSVSPRSTPAEISSQPHNSQSKMGFFSGSSNSETKSVSSDVQSFDGAVYTIPHKPAEESVIKERPKETPEQVELLKSLEEYAQSISLDKDHEYYNWEQRWLRWPGTYSRYGRAGKWQLAQCQKRIKATLEWRRENRPDVIPPEEVSIESESGKIIISGFDTQSRPLVIMHPGRENTKTSPRQIRHLLFVLERAIELMPPGVETLVLFIDFKSCSMASNPSIETARKVINILQNHYVERLGRAIIVNTPFLINQFFKIVIPFLDPQTADKLRFNPDLPKLIPTEQLWSEFGGDYQFVWDFKTYWNDLKSITHVQEDGTRNASDPFRVQDAQADSGNEPIGDALASSNHATPKPETKLKFSAEPDIPGRPTIYRTPSTAPAQAALHEYMSTLKVERSEFISDVPKQEMAHSATTNASEEVSPISPQPPANLALLSAQALNQAEVVASGQGELPSNVHPLPAVIIDETPGFIANMASLLIGKGENAFGQIQRGS